MTDAERQVPAAGAARNQPVAPSTFWQSLEGLRRDVDRVFDQFDGGFWRKPFHHRPLALEPIWSGLQHALPATDVVEKPQAYEITAELPGLERKDIDVKVSGGYLFITGEKRERKDEQRGAYHLNERRYGKFERSFLVPEGADPDGIAARFADGVLTVTLPKNASAQKTERTIDVANG